MRIIESQSQSRGRQGKGNAVGSLRLPNIGNTNIPRSTLYDDDDDDDDNENDDGGYNFHLVLTADFGIMFS